MGRKVAELNTLSDGKGITGVRFFNEIEDTNESTVSSSSVPCSPSISISVPLSSGELRSAVSFPFRLSY